MTLFLKLDLCHQKNLQWKKAGLADSAGVEVSLEGVLAKSGSGSVDVRRRCLRRIEESLDWGRWSTEISGDLLRRRGLGFGSLLEKTVNGFCENGQKSQLKVDQF